MDETTVKPVAEGSAVRYNKAGQPQIDRHTQKENENDDKMPSDRREGGSDRRKIWRTLRQVRRQDDQVWIHMELPLDWHNVSDNYIELTFGKNKYVHSGRYRADPRAREYKES